MQKKEIRRLNYLKEKGTGAWLAATPSFVCGTILSALEFRDELRDRYGLKILLHHRIAMVVLQNFQPLMLLAVRLVDLFTPVTMKVVTR